MADVIEQAYSAMNNPDLGEYDLQALRTVVSDNLKERRGDAAQMLRPPVLGGPLATVTITQTTCKRLDLFIRTVQSFLACCEDIELVRAWVVVDDRSSDEDRHRMASMFPFIRFWTKSERDAGHAKSMNVLRDQIRTPYVLHLEDDWEFLHHDRYITKCIRVLESHPSAAQCAINRGLATSVKEWNIICGRMHFTPQEYRYYVHEYHPNRLPPDLERNRRTTHWPHFTLNPAVWHWDKVSKLGGFMEGPRFELEFAERYWKAGLVTTTLDAVSVEHIGGERSAYTLNDQKQW